MSNARQHKEMLKNKSNSNSLAIQEVLNSRWEPDRADRKDLENNTF